MTDPGFPGLRGGGAPSYHLANVLPKTASKLKKLDQEEVPLRLKYLLLQIAFHMEIECKSNMNITAKSQHSLADPEEHAPLQ